MDSQSAASMAEISIALRGFGTFSGPILRYSGVEELNRRCTKLFEFAERFLSSDFEQLDETAYHLPSFITAFSNMLLLVDIVDDQHIEYLEKLISAVFVFYPQLHAAQQTRYSYALSRLFTSLFSKGSALDDLLSRTGKTMNSVHTRFFLFLFQCIKFLPSLVPNLLMRLKKMKRHIISGIQRCGVQFWILLNSAI